MAAKIKDGLFIGDAETSQSEVFINDNKISNLINVSGRDVPNVWASHGLVYLTYNWDDRPDFRLFTGHEDSILTDIVEFVDVSIAHGISVLLFSKKGTGRSAVAACLYLMVKYRWGFEKSYDYVYSKKPDIDLNKGFIQQMFALDMKLVASRQKAYALKHGIENGFKIEPNMTINDIAAMLPPTEAKRWNSWDPSYVLTPNSSQANDRTTVSHENIEETVTWSKYADSVISALRKKDQIVTKVINNKQKGNLRALDDAEEELVLIFSFINAKNTISTLPGPYYNAYDIQKQFTLRFDSVVFEEDVNWFPTSPSNSRYTFAPKGILKGVPKPAITAAAPSKQQPPTTSSESTRDSGSKPVESSRLLQRDDKPVPPPHVGLVNPRDSISIRSSPKSNNGNGSSSSAGPDDLLKYVGVQAQSKDDAPSNYPPPSIGSGNGTNGNNAPPKRQPSTSQAIPSADEKGGDSADRKPLTAEERLRKLMADMQRQQPAPSNSSGSTTGRPSSTNSSGRATGSNPNNRTDNNDAFGNEHNGSAPSLYDLANMQVQASTTAADNNNLYRQQQARNQEDKRSTSNDPYGSNNGKAVTLPTPKNGGYSRNHNIDIAIEDLDDDDDMDDPLAAFDMPAGPNSNNAGGRNSYSSSQQASQNSKAGALRARHDILSSTGGYPGARGDAGGSNGGRPGSASSRSNPVTSGRPQAWGGSTPPVPNRYASPSASGRGVPSSNSSIASQGSADNRGNYVGSGSTSGTQVYRHGSPAPNNRPAGGTTRRTSAGGTSSFGGRPVASSNNSIGSVGSMGSAGVYGTSMGVSGSGRFSPVPSPSTRTTEKTRYSSPFTANVDSQRQQGTPQRRGSNVSINSIGSSGSAAQQTNDPSRRKVAAGVSPMRASYGGTNGGNNDGRSGLLGSSQRPPSPSTAGLTSKRFSTPTPQSGQHGGDEYDNLLSSSNGASGRPSSASRNGTPSKQTWRF